MSQSSPQFLRLQASRTSPQYERSVVKVKSINFSRRHESPETLSGPHLKELTITVKLGNTDLPTSLQTSTYPQQDLVHEVTILSRDHLMMTTDTLIQRDFNTHHSAWYLSSTDMRDTILENMISNSNFGMINWDSPTRLPINANLSSPHVSLASASLITNTKWQTT